MTTLASLTLEVNTSQVGVALDAFDARLAKSTAQANALNASLKTLGEAGAKSSSARAATVVTDERKIEEALGKETMAIIRNTAAYDRMKISAEKMAMAGIRSPQQVAQELSYLANAKAAWEAAGKSAQGYDAAMSAIHSKQNLLTEGNARHRNALRQTAAAMASLAFEAAGAAFLITAVSSALIAPILPGVGLSKAIEDTRLGMASILISMGRINGLAPTLPQAMQISSGMMDKLVKDSLRFGVSIEAMVGTLRATLAPGLAAGMSLEQIQKVATIGTIAVKTIGLDSRQTVQEIRDLVAGGIQAASSTLATSLGIKDSDIKRWREAGTLYDELLKKMEGFQIAAIENANTLSGAWQILETAFSSLMMNEQGFNGIKDIVKMISEYIGHFDAKQDRWIFTPQAVAMAKVMWESVLLLIDSLKILGNVLVGLGPIIEKVSLLFHILVLDIRMVVAAVDTAVTQLVLFAKFDFAGASKAGKDWVKTYNDLSAEIKNSAFMLFGLESGIKKVTEASDEMANAISGAAAAKTFEQLNEMYNSDVRAKAEHDAKVLKLNENVWAAQLKQGRIYYEAMQELEDYSAYRKAHPNVSSGRTSSGTIVGLDVGMKSRADAAMKELQLISENYDRWLADIDDKKKKGSSAPAVLFASIRAEMEAKVEADNKVLTNVQRVEREKAKAEIEGKKLSAQSIANYVAAYNAAEIADANKAADEKLKIELDAMAKEGKAWNERLAKRAKDRADQYAKEDAEWKKVLDGVEGTFKSAFTNVLNGSKNVWIAMRDSFKTLFIDYIYAALAKPMVLNVIAGTAGMMGASGLANAATTAAGDKAMPILGGAGIDGMLTTGAGALTTTAIVGIAAVGVAAAIKLYESGSYNRGHASAEDAQKVQATGKVFGDIAAKSATVADISKSIKVNSDQGLVYSQGMLTALQNMAVGVEKTAANIIRINPSLLTGSSKEIFKASMYKGNPFESKTVTDAIVNQGIKLGGTIGDLSGQYFTDINRTSKYKVLGGLGGTKTTVDALPTQYAQMSEETLGMFNLVFQDLSDVLINAGKALGSDTKGIADIIAQFPIDIKTSLMNLKGQALTDELSRQITNISDDLAQKLFPNMERFAKVGEDYIQTVVRVANNTETVRTAMAQIGAIFGHEFKIVFEGAEITRQKMVDFSQALIDMAGGIDAFNSKFSFFSKNFLTAEQQLAPLQDLVSTTFTQLGIEVPKSRDAFTGLVQAAMAAGDPALTNALLDVAPAFSSVISVAEALAKTNQGWQDQLDVLNGVTTARDQELRGVDATTAALMKQVWAAQDAAAALSLFQGTMSNLGSRQQGLDVNLLTAKGDTVGALALARRNELTAATTGDAIKGLTAAQVEEIKVKYQGIYATEDAIKEAQYAAQVAAENARIAQQAAADQTRAAEQLKAAWQSVTDAIFAEVNRIRGILGKQDIGGAESRFAIATAQARAGDQEAAKLLPALSQALLTLAGTNAKTAVELARIQGRTAASLETTGGMLASTFGLKLPSYDVGTAYVPFDQVAMVHKGERIVPSASNDELINEIRSLRQEVAGMRAANEKNADSSKKTADILYRVTRDGNSLLTTAA